MLAPNQTQAVEEVRFANKAVALDIISQLVQQHSQHVDARETGKLAQQQAIIPTAAPLMRTVDTGDDASVGFGDQVAMDLRQADVADFARNVCAKLRSESSPRGFSVMMETLSSALARAVRKEIGFGVQAREEDITYESVPACYAHMFS